MTSIAEASERLARARAEIAGAELAIVWAVRTADAASLPASVRHALVGYDSAVIAEQQASAAMSGAMIA